MYHDPTPPRQREDYINRVEERVACKLYGAEDYKALLWAESVLPRLHKAAAFAAFTAEDWNDFDKIREITIRLNAKLWQKNREIEESNRKYDPHQPRVPAGNADGGEWTDRGGGSGGRVVLPKPKPALKLAKPVALPKPRPHPHNDSPYYDPDTGVYDPPINPTWSPFDFIGLPAKPVAVEATREAIHIYNIAKLRYIRRNVSQLTETGKGTEKLTRTQLESLKRMRKRNPSFKDSIEVTKYSDGSAVTKFKKPADNIPDSYTVYEKHIGADGRTKYVIKTTYAPDGKIVHVDPEGP